MLNILNLFLTNDTEFQNSHNNPTFTGFIFSNHAEVHSLTSVNLADGGDPDGRPDVDVPGDGGAPREVPVVVVGGELLAHVGLDDVDPLGQLHLARLLEEGREGLGEVLLVHILNADGGHLGDLFKMQNFNLDQKCSSNCPGNTRWGIC